MVMWGVFLKRLAVLQCGGVKFINNIDHNLIHDYLSSSSSEQVIVNLIERNSGTIKHILG